MLAVFRKKTEKQNQIKKKTKIVLQQQLIKREYCFKWVKWKMPLQMQIYNNYYSSSGAAVLCL